MSVIYTLYFGFSIKETDVWNSLLSEVNTTYALIGRGLLRFTEYTRLDALLNTITETAAVAVSSSTRKGDSGQVVYCLQQLSPEQNPCSLFVPGCNDCRHELVVACRLRVA